MCVCGGGAMKSIGTLDLSSSLGPWVSSNVCQSVITCDRAGSEPGASPLHLTSLGRHWLTGFRTHRGQGSEITVWTCPELGPCLFPSDRMVKCLGTSLP